MSAIPTIPALRLDARPRWTVAIPVHNCAGLLTEALAGVVEQLGDRTDVQILVVDDASTDDPAAVVARLGRGRVDFRPNPGHLGAIGTFNRCVTLAEGEFVHLLHGDDTVLPGFYDAMESALADPSALAAVCRVNDMDAAGASLHVTRSYRRGTGVWTDALETIAVSNRIRTPGIVVRRNAYERVGGYRTDLPHAADWELWTRIAAAGPIVFVDRVLARYRKHAASDSSARARTGANIRERVAVIDLTCAHVRPTRRDHVARLALAYAAAFALRGAAQQLRRRDRSAAGQQLREGLRCLRLLPGGRPALPA